MKNLKVKKIITMFLLGFIMLYFTSCSEKRQRAFLVIKSDDNNWTTSAEIYCDSVDMITENHAICWIDGRKFNLRGKLIKIYN